MSDDNQTTPPQAENHVPYQRFSQVVEQRAALEARVAELEAELEAYTVQEEMELELFARMERIYEALDRYAAANRGVYPARLEELAREGAGGARYLDPADLVDPWGDPYLYEPPAEAGGEPFVDFQE